MIFNIIALFHNVMVSVTLVFKSNINIILFYQFNKVNFKKLSLFFICLLAFHGMGKTTYDNTYYGKEGV